MKPEQKSKALLGVTRSKAKMYEFDVPVGEHIQIPVDPAKLFTLSIGLLGELAAEINREPSSWDESSALPLLTPFAAHFFDAYLQSRLNERVNPLITLIAGVAYNLCDAPGSARVLAQKLGTACPDLGGDGLEDLVLWLLHGDFSTSFDGPDGQFGPMADKLSELVVAYFKTGFGKEELRAVSENVRREAYTSGTPRQLLLADVAIAVLNKTILNSTWSTLPRYSDLPAVSWANVLQKDSFVRQLWPAQHLSGQAGVFKGESAVIQMPTSAGKTKTTELIIRSAFLSNRTGLAIIVAPFRALCHELRDGLKQDFSGEAIQIDELSDALQTDFDIAQLLGGQQVLIVTPEKLVYVLRHHPQLAADTGLVVFDEGHQFDDDTRGIVYELLITSLRRMLPANAQKVLISAVISNSEDLAKWLNDAPKVVKGSHLLPTFRSVGFLSWIGTAGKFEYIDPAFPENNEYFVPRVIEQFELPKRGRERNPRFFPERNEVADAALYLGIKLARQGSVAIYCGRKDSAAKICERAADVLARGLPGQLPDAFSDPREVDRLYNLHRQNLGDEASSTKAAKSGIYAHHGNTPHGLRLAIEHGMRIGLVRVVVCTSTLAQGVNLPIRYLLITGVKQGQSWIKVRDFHNLIGRAGRSGMHTEGSILFVDSKVYDTKTRVRENWRWKKAKELLNPENSEPCVSSLLSIFDPIWNDNHTFALPMDALGFARVYIRGPSEILTRAIEFADQHSQHGFSRRVVEQQVSSKIRHIAAIESYLLAYWDEDSEGLSEESVLALADETLAYFLADEQTKANIRELFQLLARRIAQTVPDPSRRKIYGRTLYGLDDALAVDEWVQTNSSLILAAASGLEMLEVLWPLLVKQIRNRTFLRVSVPEAMLPMATQWIAGEAFDKILNELQVRGAGLIHGSQIRPIKTDHVVDLCEKALAFDGALLVGSIAELTELNIRDVGRSLAHLQELQKRVKYGLPSPATINLYEMGFADRVVAQKLAADLYLRDEDRRAVRNVLRNSRDIAKSTIEAFPAYFEERLSELV